MENLHFAAAAVPVDLVPLAVAAVPVFFLVKVEAPTPTIVVLPVVVVWVLPLEV